MIKASLLGKNLSHSISEKLHRVLLDTLGRTFLTRPSDRKFCYDLIECAEAYDMIRWIGSAISDGYIGSNVTAPYKQLAHSHASRLVGGAAVSGSVNTLRFLDDGVEGASTDGAGLLRAVTREFGDVDLGGIDWFIVGAGGAASACLFAFAERFTPNSVTITARSKDQAENLSERFSEHYPGINLGTAGWGDFRRKSNQARMVIQATPLGQRGAEPFPPSDLIWRSHDLAIDLVYNPIHTPFLEQAKLLGVRTLGGLGMLIEQAALSQYFWFTGRLASESLLTTEEYRSIKHVLMPLLSTE